jgi:glycosyltransferase involved in cell wall biosynthesis
MSLHVVVSGWLLDQVPSGANRRLVEIVRAAAPLLAETERITVLHGHGFTPPFRDPRVDWLPTPVPKSPPWRRVLAERRLLPGLLRELRASVLDHALLPLPRVHCPVVLTVHDLRDVDGEGARRSGWLARVVLRRALAQASAVVVPSRFTAARLQARARVLPPVHVVPNGVDLAAFPASTAATDDTSGHHGYLLHVGHLEARKNLALLVRAFAALPAELRRRVSLRLAGADAGEGRALLHLAADLGIAGRVQCTGIATAADLGRLYAGAAAVCVPSRYEGFGLAALEGLATGRPVLVADAGALPEVVGPAGKVLPVDDAAAWTRAIVEVLQAGDAPGSANERRQWAGSFSWPRAAAAILQCWRAQPPAATT